MLVPYVDRTYITVGPHMTGANGNYYVGLHEYRDMAFVLHYLRPDDLFVDVGANVGSYSILASGVVGANSIAFEPVPSTVARLIVNLDANEIRKIVSVQLACVSAEVGQAQFTIDADTVNHIVRSGIETSKTAVVDVTTLDAAISRAPKLIKIDTEGTDDEVLRGADRVLSTSSPMALIVEAPSISVIQWLLSRGFHECRYDPDSRSIGTVPAMHDQGNRLFIRDTKHAQDRVASARRFSVHGFGTV